MLYVVCVPIGHPDDITVRGLRVLSEVDLIASEDPGSTQQLLAHHGIRATVTSYGPKNIKEKVAVLIDRLLKGARIALVSDSGTPVIADPGHRLISAARAHGIKVFSVPGASALTASLSVSGSTGDSFFFVGALPETTSSLKRCLTRLLMRREQSVAFCAAPFLPIILNILKQLAPRRTITLACDLTKSKEIVIRGTARQVQRTLKGRPPAQDITLLFSGKPAGRGGKRN